LKNSPARQSAEVSAVMRLVEQRPDDQSIAASEAFRVVEVGAKLALDEALKLEEAAFVPLVASENARRLIAGFLKR
jgi:hypothetical protein